MYKLYQNHNTHIDQTQRPKIAPQVSVRWEHQHYQYFLQRLPFCKHQIQFNAGGKNVWIFQFTFFKDQQISMTKSVNNDCVDSKVGMCSVSSSYENFHIWVQLSMKKPRRASENEDAIKESSEFPLQAFALKTTFLLYH